MKKIFSLIISLLYVAFLQAQGVAVVNDECEGAIFIPNVTNYCSANGAFSNVGATPSGYGPATCFNAAKNDVWFAFIATNINVTIAVTGTSPDKAGTMVSPAVALYDGECGVGNTLKELDCKFTSPGNTANFIKGGLEIGKKYLIRVQPYSGGKDGTFRLCINCFTPPKDPSGDCATASVLCDKSPFSVAYTNGVGKIGNEITKKNAPCFDNGSGGNDVETSSTWFKWTCDKAGTLTFDLIPLGVTDDIDFVVYQLPKNLDDCDNKKLLRCMASGEVEAKYPSICHGKTGLNATATDISENSGCGITSGKDNYLKALDMEAGANYVLIVNNYSDSGAGFDMSFGGTGTFLGPTAKFKTTTLKKVCFGEALTYQDESFYSNGTIKKWSWNFGQAATPKNLVDLTKPPTHTVVYNTPGQKYVSLTIESDKGCLITAIDSFTVDSCCNTVNKINLVPQIKDLACPDLLEGEIKLNPVVKLPTTYTWDLGQTTPNITNLGAGQYKVTVSNTATCDAVFTFDVKSPLPIITDTLLKKPTCNGGKDGIITLVPSGGKPAYQYDFGNGYSFNNTEKNLPVGKYPVFIKDANGCLKAITVDLKELELNLDPTIKR
jgi:SprB repeat